MHLDEDSIVQMLIDRFAARHPRLPSRVGDDAAVVRLKRADEDLVVTTDMLIEDVDFRRDWIEPSQLGHKALAANLSDLAAMGAKPQFHLVALALPDGFGKRWIASLYSGMARLGARFGSILAGGDLSGSPSGIQITIAAFGSAKRRRAVLRSGGSAGDPLLVTGCLGKSAAGLKLLQQGIVHGRDRQERLALAAHRIPMPRCEVGEWLARNRFAACMMDLSDGLSADLPRLCRAGGTGAEIFGDRIPLFEPAKKWSCDPLSLALHGGEDFELLFSVSRSRLRAFQAAYPGTFPPASIIGRLTGRHGVVWHPSPGAPPEKLLRLGWDHFRTRRSSTNSCNLSSLPDI
jgi:thiamine-monophosphate kinase